MVVQIEESGKLKALVGSYLVLDRVLRWLIVLLFLYSQERRYGYNGLGGFNPYLQQGLLRRPMPVMFKRQDQLSGSMYRSFVDSCYGLACQLGLGGMFSSIERMFSR